MANAIKQVINEVAEKEDEVVRGFNSVRFLLSSFFLVQITTCKSLSCPKLYNKFNKIKINIFSVLWEYTSQLC